MDCSPRTRLSGAVEQAWDALVCSWVCVSALPSALTAGSLAPTWDILTMFLALGFSLA